LQQWRQLLTQWAQASALSRAAQAALQPKEEPEPLLQLLERRSDADLRGLPPVLLLPANVMSAAAGVDAISIGTMLLKQDWLRRTSPRQALRAENGPATRRQVGPLLLLQ
jgi:hypothetical protein